MENIKLSIIIPAFNESATLPELLRRVEGVALSFPREIIIVDDASSDGTRQLIEAFLTDKKKTLNQVAACRSAIRPKP